MKDNLTLLLGIFASCLLWYVIFIFTDQLLAAVFLFASVILAIVNVSWLIGDIFIVLKDRIGASLSGKELFIGKLMNKKLFHN